MHRLPRLLAFLRSPCVDLFLIDLPTPVTPLTDAQWQAEFGPLVADADDERETRNHHPYASAGRDFNPHSSE